MRALRPALLLLSLSLLAAVGQAQNLVTNGSFDSNVSGWSPLDTNVTITWNATDAGGSPSSGSLLASNNSATAADSGFVQCVGGLTAGTVYSFGAKVLVPSGGPRGRTSLQIDWNNGPACSGAVLSVDFLGTSVHDAWVPLAGSDTAPAGTHSALVFGEVFKNSAAAAPYRSYFDDIFLEVGTSGGGICTPDATTLCIDDQPGDKRFKVQGTWRAAGFGSGTAKAISLSSLGVVHGGLLWFFSADNPEILVKVLNGCTVNQKHWVFFAADTNVEFTVTVTDMTTGISRSYFNPLNNPAGPLQDTGAFPCP